MKTIKDRDVVCIYDSLSDAFDQLSVAMQDPYYHDEAEYRARRRYRDGGYDFLGKSFASFADVKDSVARPWEEGMTAYEHMRTRLGDELQLVKPKSTKRRRKFSDDGDIVIDRALSGEFEYCQTVARLTRQAPKNVVMVVNLSASFNIRHGDFIWRTAAAAIACDLLEAQGYSCEIWGWKYVNDSYEHHIRNFYNAFCVKRGGEQLDINTVLCGLSAWFYRLVTIQACDVSEPERAVTARSGYGTPTYNNNKYENYLDEMGISRSSTICQMNNCTSEHQAVANVLEILKTATGEEINLND